MVSLGVSQPPEMKTYTLLTDEVLADLVKAQDVHAYTELYQRYWGVLHRFCHRLLRDEAQATDTVQDVFVHFWENAPQLELRFSLSSYLYGAARNQVIRHIRKEKVKASYIELDEDKTINNIQSNYTTKDSSTNQINVEPTFYQDGSSEKIVDALTTLTKTVADLATQVAELKNGK